MIISHIVAIANENAIGQNKDLLFRLSADMKLFKSLTTGHHILMGRKNYESIGRALPNRTSIIITRNPDHKEEGCHSFTSIEDGIAFAKKNGETELFIIGGGEIYKQTFSLIDKLYLSKVNETFEKADTFYPNINFDNWKIIESEKFLKNEKNEFDFEFFELEKKTDTVK